MIEELYIWRFTFYKLVTPYTSFRISDSIKAVEICGIFFVFQSRVSKFVCILRDSTQFWYQCHPHTCT